LNKEVSFWKRYRALITFLLILAAIFVLAYIFRSELLPFIIGLIFAYLLLPLIKWAEQRLPPKNKWMSAKRIFLIIFAFILGISLLVGFIVYFYYGVRDVVSDVINKTPEYISTIQNNLESWYMSIFEVIPPQYQQQISDFFSSVNNEVGKALQVIFSTGIGTVPRTVGLIAGFLALPFFLFFILKDAESLKTSFYDLLPKTLTVHTQNIFTIIDNVVGKYIRAQLLLGFVVAILVFIGLSILGIKLAPVLAIFAGIMELIPTVGPWISGILGVLLILAIDPSKFIPAIIVYVAANLLENLLLVPRIQGGFLRINPAILMVGLVLGASLGGIWGMVLAGPLIALALEIYKYIRSISGSDENA